MNRKRISAGSAFVCMAGFTFCAVLIGGAPIIVAQAQAQAAAPRPAQAEPPSRPGPADLKIQDGTTASYRVQEQLAGVNFPTEAVGGSNSVTGTIYLNADGSVDSSKSKLIFDLRTLKSDQDMRDGYIQKRVLNTEQFPTAEFVPRTVQGITWPLPGRGQMGFQMTGDMTIHGVTAPITWTGVTTVNRDDLAGRATTDFTFTKFSLPKPSLARLLSVGDKITLEVAFHLKRS